MFFPVISGTLLVIGFGVFPIFQASFRPLKGLTHTGEKTQRTAREVRLPRQCAVLLSLLSLPYLRHQAPYGLCRIVLFLPCGVGVGPRGEPGVVVSQHGGYRLDVRTVLKRQRGEVCRRLLMTERTLCSANVDPSCGYFSIIYYTTRLLYSKTASDPLPEIPDVLHPCSKEPPESGGAPQVKS